MNNYGIYGFMKIFLSFALIVFIIGIGCGGTDDNNTKCPNTDSEIESAKGTYWTIMIYADGDNNLEDYLLLDIEEMKSGFINDQGLNVIVLVDRLEGDSCTGFNDKFTDTRLYKISNNKTTRIGGSTQFPQITTSSKYEANMGDAQTLKKFIQFCKNNDNYAASNYALVLWNHGAGPMKKKSAIADDETQITSSPFKGVCSDDTSGGDILYTAEITDVLTSTESVDLLGARLRRLHNGICRGGISVQARYWQF